MTGSEYRANSGVDFIPGRVYLGGRSALQVARACSFMAASGGRSTQILLAVCVQYYTKSFKEDKWAIHYYARVEGHELVTRRDLIPSEPDHPRAGQWYYKLLDGRRNVSATHTQQQ